MTESRYVTNPDCPECNGLAGKMRLVAYRVGGRNRHNVFEDKPFHCRRCLIREEE